jgi:hypothetical protein
MTDAARRYISTAIAVAAILFTNGCRQSPRVEEIAPRGQTSAAAAPADTSFAAMNERGKTVMGVDQYASTHSFTDAADGGRIGFTSDSGANADVEQIRTHLKAIAKAFAMGDFADPEMIHMAAVPGTDVMKERRASIRYTYIDVPKGGEVRITTTDPVAVKAVHAFLEFQRTAHHTHEMNPA